MEEWKDIEGYEGLYQVSNLGRVKSLWFDKEKILKAYKNRYGYLCIGLCKYGKKKTYKIHRLVASAFIENSNNYPEVNHKDEVKTNNNVNNLEWCTREYNHNFGTRNQRVAEKNSAVQRNNPKVSKPVIGINKINGYIVEFPQLMKLQEN